MELFDAKNEQDGTRSDNASEQPCKVLTIMGLAFSSYSLRNISET